MLQLAMGMMQMQGPNQNSFWFSQAIGAIALFGIFLPISVWTDNRRKEREAYYKAETLRRLAESSADGAKSAIALLYENERISVQKKREGLKIGGLVCLCVGIGLGVFLYAEENLATSTIGLIPGLIGVALLVYVLVLAGPLPESKMPEDK